MKLLSLILRHKPEIVGLNLETNGYVETSLLLQNLKKYKNIVLTLKNLEEIVFSNDKKRFEFNFDHTKIRASQGHSIETPNLQNDWEEILQPIQLFHGTSKRLLGTILSEGLSKMTRTHVHLTNSAEIALKTAKRHSSDIVVLELKTKEFLEVGNKIWKSQNDVYLTNFVEGKFLQVFLKK